MYENFELKPKWSFKLNTNFTKCYQEFNQNSKVLSDTNEAFYKYICFSENFIVKQSKRRRRFICYHDFFHNFKGTIILQCA